MAYAKMITRDYLEYLGITDVSEDGTKIMRGDKELPQHFDGYYNSVFLYDPAIRQSVPKEERTNTTGQFSVGVHRIVYTWYNKIVPTGYVIDHRNSIKTDNRLENLQLFTPKENINKERGESTRQVKCKLNKSRKFYEDKLKKYEELYELAKLNKDSKSAHHLRTNISQTRARIRYWDANQIEEDNNMTEQEKLFKEKLKELKYWKQIFKDNGNKKLWHECCTIEKIVKEKKIEAMPVVEHALDVIYTHFKRQ